MKKNSLSFLKRALACAMAVIMMVGVLPIMGVTEVNAESTKYQVGDIIEFGEYPQTLVTDATLIEQLNSLSTTWYPSICYYGEGDALSSSDLSIGTMQPVEYGKYADVNFFGKKYRAICFSNYRSAWTTQKVNVSKIQKTNGYYTNQIYWFSYDPIRWIVMDPNQGVIMSEQVIDAQAFSDTIYEVGGGYYSDASGNNAVSDFNQSSLYNWLNNAFYQTAFSAYQKSILKPTNTGGYVSLATIINTKYDHAYGTDYAKANGLWVDRNRSSGWWQDPSLTSSYSKKIGGYDAYKWAGVWGSHFGARPVVYLNINQHGDAVETENNDYEHDTAERLYILGKGLTSYKAQNHLDYGESYQLKVFHYPSMEQITEGLTWYSSDSSVISVNSSGLITGHKKGYAYIYASTASGLLSRHGYFVYVGDYKITGSEPDEFIYFAQNNNLSVADAAYVDLHLNFINSRKYEDRMNNRWGKYLGAEIIDDKVGTVAEFFYQVVNTATEIAECKTLSQFENPYVVILADFMMSQSIGDARVSSAYEVYGTNEMKAFKVLKKYFQTSDAWVSEWNSSTDIKKIIQAVKKDYSSTGLYNVLQNALVDIISETGLNDLLASVDMLDGLMQLMSNFGDVVDWFYDCYNFTLSVSSYIETSDVFKDVLRNVGKAAEQNEGTYYNQLSKAINSYISVLSPDDIANSMLKKFASEGAKTLYNMVADDAVDSVKAWVTKKAGLSNALVAKLSQAEFWATLALNTGWKIGNWATGNDGAVAARELIRANHFFEHLLFLELKNRETDLRSKQTYTAALYFDEVFQMLKCSELYALEQSQNYIDSVDNLWNYIIHGFSAEKYADQRSFSVAQISAWKLVNCHTNSQINDYLDRYQYYSKQKVVRVACPTDVEVKNSDGEVVLRIENNEIVFCADDITASVDGDIKYFSVTNSNDYYISIVATDNGSMDYKVDEYTDLGEYIGSYTNEKISIVKDETFKGVINNEENDVDYTLTNSNGESLNPQFYDDSSKVDVASIETTSEKTMKYGDEEYLNYVVLPEKASTKTTTITSSDSNVVEIGVNGKLKAVGEGSAIITITALDGGVSTSCSVTVTHNYFKTVVEPSCSLEGMDLFTCTGCGNNYMDSIVPALGHSFTNYVSNNDATCTADGTKTAKCDRCDVTDTVTDEGSAKGHTIVIDKAAAPTCTETGLTEGKHCSVCNTVLVKQEVIPATGHNDNNSDGTCDRCGEKAGEPAPSNPSHNCSCSCHKKGIANFFFKIILFFQKIFK